MLASIALALCAFQAPTTARGFAVVAPAEWQSALQPLIDARKAELAVEFAPLEDVLATQSGVDAPERLKRFLYQRLYGAEELDLVRAEAERVVTNLAAVYRENPSLLPAPWRDDRGGIDALRNMGDFIAGMTDRFAIARHEELVGPVHLPADRF